ncbi:unnamed protein product [Paramecium sonneborni]|nr:unnamed protein product [Paramecium sonneborni]
MEDRSQRLNELESVIQYLSLFKRIKESHSQKKSQNQCPQITNLSVDCLQKSCVKTRNFNTKIWSKVNCDEDSYAGRKFSIEKVETNRDSKISPCLKVSQAIRFQRSNSYLTNLRTEMKRNILNQNQYSRSRSVMRQNVLLVFVENYLTKNQGTKRI